MLKKIMSRPPPRIMITIISKQGLTDLSDEESVLSLNRD